MSTDHLSKEKLKKIGVGVWDCEFVAACVMFVVYELVRLSVTGSLKFYYT